MKKISLLVIIALAISLCSCNANTEQPSDSTDDTATSTIESTQQVYDYEEVAKIHDSFQKCSSFLTTEMNFCKSMWEISKYDDDKDVHNSFVNYISKQGADKTISDSVSALSQSVDRALESCDPSLAPLLKDVSEKYSELTVFFTNPSGSYKEYMENYNACFDEFVIAFDEMTAYLYDVGYYTE